MEVLKPVLQINSREKKWVTIGDTTMKIYKWVPVTSSDTKKVLKHRENKENLSRKNAMDTSNSNSNFSLAEDSNTCEYFEVFLNNGFPTFV